MKNVTLGLNVVLGIAVAVLFYLHFASPVNNSISTVGTKAVPSGSFKIAYFETDSIQNQFEFLRRLVLNYKPRIMQMPKYWAI